MQHHALKEELRSIYNKLDHVDAKLDQVLKILQTKEIQDISVNNSPKNKRGRTEITVDTDIIIEEQHDTISSALVDPTTSESILDNKIISDVPSSSLVQAHTALSKSFVSHYIKQDDFLPNKEKNRWNRCISFMKTLLNDDERSFLSYQVPSPSDGEYASWRNELNDIADSVQERAMIRLLQLEGKDPTKKYKLRPAIPAVDRRLTSIGESKWKSECKTV